MSFNKNSTSGLNVDVNAADNSIVLIISMENSRIYTKYLNRE